MSAGRLEDVIERLRKPPRGDPRQFISTWREKEILDGEVADCLVVVLRTKGCHWSRSSGCSMCGYINDCAEAASGEDVLHQFEEAMATHAGERYLKIYTSGSFLDEDEIDLEAANSILERALSAADRVLIESRAEFVTRERIMKTPERRKIEVAMGMESASDVVLEQAISKNASLQDFQRACRVCRDADVGTRAYVLIKPPFLTEEEAILDAKRAAQESEALVDTISFNPVNVQKNTLVEYLWKRGEYRSPWLWSVLDVIGEARSLRPHIVVSTAGAGSRRGPHNCGKCDSRIIDFLRDFSIDNDLEAPEVECGCLDEWHTLLEVQGPMQCSADPARFYDR